jgi:hypothetical protein
VSQKKIQERYESFVRDFMVPVMDGGRIELGRAVAPGMLDAFALSKAADLELDRTMVDRLQRFGAEIAPMRSIPWPDRGLAAIAMACHCIAFATDPALSRVGGRGPRKRVIEFAAWFVEAAGAPRTRGQTLVRHAFLSRFLETRREDVTATNWGFTHRYLGRPVPDGFLTKPRWVDLSTQATPILDLWHRLDPDLTAELSIDRLLSRSPVTSLLRFDLTNEVVFGTAALAVLSDDLVRNGIARALVGAGTRAMKPLGRALRSLYAEQPPPALLYYPIALVYEMHVIAALDARSGNESIFARPSQPDEALFCAILPALVGAPDDLGALLELDPDDLLRVRRLAADLDQRVGEDAARHAVQMIDYATPPALDHERDPALPPAAQAPAGK